MNEQQLFNFENALIALKANGVYIETMKRIQTQMERDRERLETAVPEAEANKLRGSIAAYRLVIGLPNLLHNEVKIKS